MNKEEDENNDNDNNNLDLPSWVMDIDPFKMERENKIAIIKKQINDLQTRLNTVKAFNPFKKSNKRRKIELIEEKDDDNDGNEIINENNNILELLEEHEEPIEHCNKVFILLIHRYIIVVEHILNYHNLQMKLKEHNIKILE